MASSPALPRRKGPTCRGLAASSTPTRAATGSTRWVKEPNRYHPRTVMPNLFLDPIVEKDPPGKPTGAGHRSGGRHHGVPAGRADRLEAENVRRLRELDRQTKGWRSTIWPTVWLEQHRSRSCGPRSTRGEGIRRKSMAATVKVDETRAGRRSRELTDERARAATRVRRPPVDRQVRLLRLPRHSGFRRGQADRHGAGRLGPQGSVEAGVREHPQVPDDAR